MRKLAAGAAVAPASLAFAQPEPFLPAAEKKAAVKTPYIFDVRDFGAAGDGVTLCTTAIQKTIDACAAKGGGRVVVPPGKYLSAPLFLKSNLEFEVMAGATLLGTTKFDDYPTIQGRWEGNDRTIFASLLTGIDLENVSIVGSGIIDGQGETWWKANRETNAMRRQLGIEGREPENPPGAPLKWPRPRTIYLHRCKNILLRDVTILNSPSWTVHPVLCENVNIDGISIIGVKDSPNTDGIDPDSCRNVRINNCYISTGDDCIVIKSGYKHVPGATQIPSENIAISNCVFGFGQAGVAIGSETAGGVRNVAISNCVCEGTRRGLYIKSARGRGNVVENVRASNLVMKSLVDTAVSVGMYYNRADRGKQVPLNDETPMFRNFRFSDILVDGSKRGVVVEGLPENPIQGFALNNISLRGVETGVVCSQVHGASFENVVVNAEMGAGVSVDNVQNLELVRIRAEKSAAAQPLIHLEKVEAAVVASCVPAAENRALLEIRGNECQGITLALNRVPKGVQELALVEGASAAVVEKRA